MKPLRPIDIARKLNISTSTLRSYEDRGLVPPVKRLDQRYRAYSQIHVAYFECIVNMAPSFGMDITSSVLKMFRRNNPHHALWVINQEQTKNGVEKELADHISSNISKIYEYKVYIKKPETVGNVAKIIGLSPSTIRYWEDEGYIQSFRQENSNYRLYDSFQFIKIFLMKLSQSLIYSEDVVALKQSIKEIKDGDIEATKMILNKIYVQFNIRNKEQLRGLYYLYQLWEMLGFDE
ncbi:MerR family DNA-binding transcriptional regulator [Pseudalkalibacillus salsuginis]|uniref:MerR family DNA-binding transcriptional regulator n=1 Tax=Pseudalkalibacillus salsuginis TaxID=2910972 RepID=UPI001F20A709|nr:MerR family DNA-binding transcriptional regulator [Pseudalkalibacillus salsuginis]MCF6409425.1 MerR family DNA-binding transcriptional regulator [Pseudalkalibacillus salsuginis]